ncbi:hypothetical protein ANCCEY_15342, partial [Ancylostoma ceylanicum]
MLLGFQDDLGTISEDMKRLQDQSVSINQVLVMPFRVIMEADVSDRTFLEQLHELQHKINFVRAQEFKDARAVYDVMGVLESLKFKVQEEYVDTISKMFFSYFKAYISRLFKLMMSDAASKDDLLGVEDSVKSSGLTGLFTGKPH